MAKKKLNPLEHLEQETKKLDREAKREWRNALKFMDENHLLFMGFVFLLAAAVIINTVYVINRSGKPVVNGSATAAYGTIYKSLDQAENRVAKVSIANVTESDTPDPAFPLNDTQTLLVLDLTITNKTAVTQHLIPSTQLFVHDRDGGLYILQASSRLTNALAAQDLSPGASATGQVAFAVPKRQTTPLLYIDVGWDNDTPIIYDVLH